MRALLAAIALALTAAAPAQAALELRETKVLSERLRELTFHTDALAAETKARILLPAGYDATPARRWPVLYLLHGAVDDYASWTAKGDAERLTATLPAIVVMPDTGPGGGYTDWFDPPATAPRQWERYHVGQLLPWVDAHLRTRRTRAARAIAGLSMGGYGTMHYAARHPDLFVSATSLSGAVDTNRPAIMAAGSGDGLSEGKPFAVYGPRVTNEIHWRGHNPWDLAANLRGLDLTLRTGNGQPGGPGGDTGDPVELAVWDASTSLHERLDALGVRHVWDDYGAGGHAWYYWQRGLRQLVEHLPTVFADPPRRPARITYRSVDAIFTVFGWRVAIDRPAKEWAELRDAGRDEFTLRGSGTAKVVTPANFTPRERVRATIGGVARPLRAGRDGRVRLTVWLGPGNPHQQLTPQAAIAGGTRVGEAHVRFAR